MQTLTQFTFTCLKSTIKTKTRRESFTKLTIETPELMNLVSIVNFEQFLLLVLVFLQETLNS